MRWNAATLLATVALLCTAGCQEPQNDQDMQDTGAQTTSMEPDYFVSDPAPEPADNSYTEFPALTASASTTETPAASDAVHIVAKGDTLYALARKYYNDERRWKDIYEANRDRISNPDLIGLGQELVIP